MYTKLLKFTGIFYKLRCYVSVYVLRLLYFAFVHSQLLYGIEVYANTRHAQLNKLCVLNNKILRIIQSKPLRTPVLQLYQSYNTLPIPNCTTFNSYVLFSNILTVMKNYQLFLQTSLLPIVKFTLNTLELLMISIYPESVLPVESDVLNLKLANCGTTYQQN